MSRQDQPSNVPRVIAEDEPLTPRALGEFILRKYGGLIYRWAEPRVLDLEIARDTVADVAVAAMRQYQKGNWRFLSGIRTVGQLENMLEITDLRHILWACLQKITQRITADAIEAIVKKKENLPCLFTDPDIDIKRLPDDPKPDFAVMKEDAYLVWKMLGQLRDTCRVIIIDKVFDSKTFAKIAADLDMIEATVKTKHRRAMIRLRELAQRNHL